VKFGIKLYELWMIYSEFKTLGSIKTEMATESPLTAADPDGDGKLDLIAAGRATNNMKIYWNRR